MYHNKNWLRFPYVFMVSRPHYLPTPPPPPHIAHHAACASDLWVEQRALQVRVVAATCHTVPPHTPGGHQLTPTPPSPQHLLVGQRHPL
jgi:hypothetical protein